MHDVDELQCKLLSTNQVLLRVGLDGDRNYLFEPHSDIDAKDVPYLMHCSSNLVLLIKYLLDHVSRVDESVYLVHLAYDGADG